MISAWPEYQKEWDFAQDERAVEMMKEAVRSIRNIRSEMNVPPARRQRCSWFQSVRM